MTIPNVRKWLEIPPVIERHGEIDVLRDDLIDGGTKARFLPFLINGAKEVVFGGPFCGGAPYTLAVLGRESGIKVTLFYAKRKNHHRRQVGSLKHGAKIYEVPYGYMTNVQSKAKRYAEDNDALFLPLGFDVPEAEDPFVEFIESIRKKQGDYDEVWCTVGSGMLARCLSRGFPNSSIQGVSVGLKSRQDKQDFGGNVTVHESGYKFAQPSKGNSPFPSCENYDKKAWEQCVTKSKNRALFWNVMG